MSNFTPLLSVVIPTRNRQYCLEYTIKIVLNCYDNIEIVVLDSSDDLPDENLFNVLKNKKCIYVRTSSFNNAVQNFNEAINYINGDFVTFIGDDDIITSEIGFVLNYMMKNSVDSAISTFPINYNWPGFQTTFNKGRLSGSLVIRKFCNSIVEVKLDKEIQRVINELTSGPLNLPRAYLGIVSATLIERVYKKYGNLFGGVSPDIYSSYLLATESNKCVLFDTPFIIPGAFTTSTSATSAAGKHKSAIGSNDHTGRFPGLDEIWNYNVPFIYTVQTVWSFSLIEAFRLVNNKDINDYSPLYASLFSNFIEFRKDILNGYKNVVDSGRFNHLNFISKIFKNVFLFFYLKLNRKKVTIMQGFDNNLDALNYLNSQNKLSHN